jgi:hypothetical protein
MKMRTERKFNKKEYKQKVLLSVHYHVPWAASLLQTTAAGAAAAAAAAAAAERCRSIDLDKPENQVNFGLFGIGIACAWEGSELVNHTLLQE